MPALPAGTYLFASPLAIELKFDGAITTGEPAAKQPGRAGVVAVAATGPHVVYAVPGPQTIPDPVVMSKGIGLGLKPVVPSGPAVETLFSLEKFPVETTPV